jgi:ATP-dependent protease ClpP protease subunit
MALMAVLVLGTGFFSSSKCETRWSGTITYDFFETVRKDLQAAKGCEKLVVTLYSPGGAVFDTLEVVREMQAARKAGLVIEIHARTLVASGATFVLGAGSPGHRYVSERALGLVHGIQQSWTGCTNYKEYPVTENDKFLNALIEQLVREYSELSGKPIRETAQWLACDNTQLGRAEFLVKLGLADHVE